MLRVTDYVMWFAPIGIFGALAAAITTQGLGVLATYGKFIGSFYLGIVLLWTLLIGAGFVFLGSAVFRLMREVRDPLFVAFTTASSEAAYPKLMAGLQRFGVNDRVSSLCCRSATRSTSTARCSTSRSPRCSSRRPTASSRRSGTQVTMLLVMMVSSKGVAGVPRASLVVVAAVLPTFGLPEAGLLLILGIDQFLDMGRTATNVIGNSIATSVVARWKASSDRRATAMPSRLPRSSPRPIESMRPLERFGHRDRATGAWGRMLASLGAAVALALAIAAAPAAAQDDRAAPVEVLSGTLKRIAQSGTIRLGYRTDAAPFSFVSKAGEVHGYSIDLCRAIAGRLATRSVASPARRVPPGNRGRPARPRRRGRGRPRVRLDDQHGGTARASVSPVIFVTGTRLAVRRDAGIRGLADLAGRSVAVVRGTTNEAALRGIVARQGLRVGIVATDDLVQAFELLALGRVDAVGGDDVLLVGHLVDRRACPPRSRRRAAHVRALRHRLRARRPAVAVVVERAMRDLARAGELRAISTSGSCARCRMASGWARRWAPSSRARSRCSACRRSTAFGCRPAAALPPRVRLIGRSRLAIFRIRQGPLVLVLEVVVGRWRQLLEDRLDHLHVLGLLGPQFLEQSLTSGWLT